MSSSRPSTRSSNVNANSNSNSPNANNNNNGNSTNSNRNSIRTPKSPTWRSVSVVSSKNTPSAATLSYVFAEPELAKKSSRGTMRSSRSQEAVTGNDLANSLVALNGASTSSPTLTAQHTPNEDNRGNVHTRQLHSTNAAEPDSGSPTSPGVSLTKSKSATSWFGSLSRQKGRQRAEVIRTNVDGNVDVSATMKGSSERIRSKLAEVLDLHDCPPSPISEPTLNSPAAQLPPLPFPSPNPNTPSRLTSASPDPAPPTTTSSAVPGEEVPKLVVDLAPSPEAEGSSAGVVPSTMNPSDGTPNKSGGGESSVEPRARLSSLNPSTSRFALSIPLLLGRASAGGKGQAKDDIGQSGSSGNVDGITTTTGQNGSTAMSTLPAASSSVTPPPPAAVMKPTDPETTIPAPTSSQPAPPAPASSSSWWGYGPASASGSKSNTSIMTSTHTPPPPPPPEAAATTTSLDVPAPLAAAPATLTERNYPSSSSAPSSSASQAAPPPSTASSWWGYGPASASESKTKPSDPTPASTSTSTPPLATADVAPLAPTPVIPEHTSIPISASAVHSEPPSIPQALTSTTSDLPASTSSSSWWGYVGWEGTTSAPPPSQPLATDVKEREEGKGSETIHVAPLAAITADASLLEGATGSGTSSSIAEGPERDRKNEIEKTREDKDQSRNRNKGTSSSASGAGATLMAMTSMAPVPVTVLESVEHGGSSGTVQVEHGETGQKEGKGEGEGEEERKRDGAVTGGVWYSPWSWYGAAGSTTTDGVLCDVGHGDNAIAIHENGGPNRDGDGDKCAGTSGETGGDIGDFIAGTGASGGGGDGDVHPEVGLTSAVGVEGGGGGGGETNPIGSTFVTSRAGWASFFSSGSLVVKRITGSGDMKRDEHGAEVMDIDEPDEMVEKSVVTSSDGVEKRKESGAVTDESERTPSKKVKDHELTRGRDPATIKPTDMTPKPAPLLTISDSVKRQTIQSNLAKSTSAPASPAKAAHIKSKKSTSPAPSTKSAGGSGRSSPVPPPKPPNMVLPAWQDTFHTAPRDVLPPEPETAFSRAMGFVSGVLFASDGAGAGAGIGGSGANKSMAKGKEDEWLHFGKELPRAWDIVEKRVEKAKAKETGVVGKLVGKGKGKVLAGVGASIDPDVLRGCKRVVVIGIHGWFPGAMMRTVIGEPTGTSPKFVNMMVQALEEFQDEHNVRIEKITKIPLEGEGTIDGRVLKLYANLQSNQEWMEDLHAADVIFVATHSQGSVVSTHLLDRLIMDNHIRTTRNAPLSMPGSIPGGAVTEAAPAAGMSVGANVGSQSAFKPQRICCLALCGIHLGPLRYLKSSSLVKPYFQYFESMATRELFEFQNTESEVSKSYVEALSRVVDHGAKMVYVASLNDQVVPIYSGLFTAASHPLILRALYVDGDAYRSSDFLSNLLVLLLRMLNSGIPDSGLLVHLSEATAGSLNGIGHSAAYEELATYSLAVKYLFLTNDGLQQHPELVVEPFDALSEQNDYEIPWSLRDIIGDVRVAHFFAREIAELRDAFRDWHPKTSILRDLKRKLQPIQRLPTSFTSIASSSKL